MLVLSRKPDERIVIALAGRDEPITITVLDFRAGSVRLGITADPDIPVHRLEVHEAIRRKEVPPRKAS